MPSATNRETNIDPLLILVLGFIYFVKAVSHGRASSDHDLLPIFTPLLFWGCVMRKRFMLSRIKLLLLLAATGWLTAACQTVTDQDDSVSIEDAKKRPIIYRAIDNTPPRDISDIRALLAQAAAKPVRPETSAIVARQAPHSDDKWTLARFYWQRGRAAGELGMDQLELEDLRRAAEYAKGFDNDEVEEDRILAELAASETRVGNLLTASRLREQSIALSASTVRGNIGLRISNYRSQVQTYSRLGERSKAREALAQAEVLLAKGKHKPFYGWFSHNWPTSVTQAQADLLEDEGKFEQAESYRRQALADRKQDIQDNLERTKRGLTNIAQIIPQRLYAVAGRELAFNLIKQQRLVEAEVILRRMIYTGLSNSGRYFIGTGLNFLAFSEVLYEQGRYSEAREAAEIALEIFNQLELRPESLNMVNARRSRAAALSAETRYGEALRELETMKQGLAASPLLLARLGRGDIDWALALIRTGRAPEAVSMLEPLALELRDRLGADHYESAVTRAFLAYALSLTNRRDVALKLFAETMPILTAAGASTDGSTRSPLRTRRYVLLLEAYLDLLVELRGSAVAKAAGIDAEAEAFRVADMARAQGFQLSFTSGLARSAATDPALAVLVKREQDAAQHLSAQRGLLVQLLAAPPAERSAQAIERMRVEIASLDKESRRLFAEIAQGFPSYANLLHPQPASMDNVRAKLGQDEAMISVYVGAQRTYVWALAKNGPPAFAISPLGTEAMEQSVTRLRKSLDPGSASLGEMPEFDVAEANKLYQSLLKPVESVWRGKNSLLIVPHRALSQLPFALLTTEESALKSDKKLLFDSYRAIPWLVRNAAITQYPSANAFLSLRGLAPADPNRRSFIGFGDPLFNQQQLTESQQPLQTMQFAAAAPTTRGLHLPLRNLKVDRVNTAADVETGLASTVANTSQLAQVPRLPDTGDEIREIAAALGADAKQDVFLQLRANEEQVKKMDLSHHRIVMFATHGLVPGELNGLNQPALALTAPALAGGNGDGLLTMEEVLQLKLNADWVVLSACNTAAGDGQGGDAVSGLGRAFFYAGSRALLVTNWPVETTSARALTTTLFRRQAADAQLTRAQALRQAMLQLIDGPGYMQGGKSIYAYAHPLFWAPYSLVGEGGR